jgi:hypothetical protein
MRQRRDSLSFTLRAALSPHDGSPSRSSSLWRARAQAVYGCTSCRSASATVVQLFWANLGFRRTRFSRQPAHHLRGTTDDSASSTVCMLPRTSPSLLVSGTSGSHVGSANQVGAPRWFASTFTKCTALGEREAANTTRFLNAFSSAAMLSSLHPPTRGAALCMPPRMAGGVVTHVTRRVATFGRRRGKGETPRRAKEPGYTGRGGVGCVRTCWCGYLCEEDRHPRVRTARHGRKHGFRSGPTKSPSPLRAQNLINQSLRWWLS